MPGVLRKLDRLGRWLEDGLLFVMLSTMIGLAALQILLRNAFDGGFIWADGLLRILVLWVALLGAVAASREDHHIRIDALARYLPPRVRLAARIVSDIFTAAVCTLITWHAVRFVHLEYEFGSTVLSDQPAWIAELILPVGFGIIAYRYVIFVLRHTMMLAKGMTL